MEGAEQATGWDEVEVETTDLLTHSCHNVELNKAKGFAVHTYKHFLTY